MPREAHNIQDALLDCCEWNLATLELMADRKRTSQSDLTRLATIAWRTLHHCQTFVPADVLAATHNTRTRTWLEGGLVSEAVFKDSWLK